MFAKEADGSVYLRGAFVNYAANLHLALHQAQVSTVVAKRLYSMLQNIVWDLWNIGTLVERLEWMDRLAIAGTLEQESWRHYCSLDIEHFHVEARSLLDYVAACIAAVARRPQNVPPKSMSDLLAWLEKNPGNVQRLGIGFAVLVRSFPGFLDLKEVRDETIHRGGLTLVFGKPGEGLVFQVHRRSSALIKPRIGALDNDLIDFRHHGALVVADILLFLEKLAPLLWDQVCVKHPGLGDAKLCGPGWDVLVSWLESNDSPSA